MKWILTTMLAVGLSQWAIQSQANAEDVKCCANGIIKFVTNVGEEGADNHNVFVVQAGDPGETGFVVATALANGDDKNRSVVRWVTSGNDNEDRAWLGVTLQAVPAALAAQMDLEELGVLITNVVEDSPAAKAGVEVHDVLLAIGEDEITGSNSTSEVLANYDPDNRTTLTILRDGEEKILNIKLGSRPEGGAFSWKFRTRSGAQIDEQVRTSARIMSRDDDGKWVLKNLGEIKELSDLPSMIQAFIPRSGSHTISLQVGGDDGASVGVIHRDGETLTVKQQNEGDIVVKRIDEDGNETVATYADGDELREADEEAADLYDRIGNAVVIDIDGLPNLGDFSFNFDLDNLNLDLEDFNFNLEDFQDQFGDWEVHMEENMGAAREAYERAMEGMHEAHERMTEQFGDMDFQAVISDGRSEPGTSPKLGRFFGPHIMGLMGKPRYNFEKLDDGTIEVRIRKGDSELVKTFSDEEDMEDRAPKLYSRYEALTKDDE